MQSEQFCVRRTIIQPRVERDWHVVKTYNPPVVVLLTVLRLYCGSCFVILFSSWGRLRAFVFFLVALCVVVVFFSAPTLGAEGWLRFLIVTCLGIFNILSIRPEQELDLRKLTFLGSVLHNKNKLEHEIAQRQLAVKYIESKSWFADCNRLLYRYIPNIYHVEGHLETMEGWKSVLKKHIDSYSKRKLAETYAL